jgi:UMF1 family MFS transporter
MDKHLSSEAGDERVDADKRGIWGWMLFDFAAQPYHTLIITFIFAPYFASFIASDPVSGQSQWGYGTAIAGAIIAIMSPILGSIADSTGPRKPWIMAFSVLGFIGAFMLWWGAPHSEGNSSVFIALLALIILMVGFEFAAVFNNAMMPTLVPREKLGRLSGNAWSLGYTAGLFTLIIVLLTMASNEKGLTLLGIEPLFGIDATMKEGERATGPLTAIWYLVFVLPLFMFTPDIKRKKKVAGAAVEGIKNLVKTIKKLPQNPSLFAYLGSSMLYRDALNGLYAFGGIYAVGVLEWSIVQVGIFGILANITGVIGAYLGGRMDDRFGPKFVVRTSIIILSISSLVIITTDINHAFFIRLAEGSSVPTIIFYICGGFIGAAGGALQAASRTLMADQAEPGRMTEAFGLYAMSGRATAFLAPLMIAIFTDISGSQRIGVIPVVVLFIAGLILLNKVHQRNGQGA